MYAIGLLRQKLILTIVKAESRTSIFCTYTVRLESLLLFVLLVVWFDCCATGEVTGTAGRDSSRYRNHGN